MRLAPTFLLSMLFAATMTWMHVAAHWANDSAAGWQMPAPSAAMSDVQWIVELEDDLDLGLVEPVSVWSPNVFALVTQEDRTEVFWPPKPLDVVQLDSWEPPQAHVLWLRNPWPRYWLRPPNRIWP